MYQQQPYHPGQGPLHQNIYLVRGPNGQPVYVDGYTLKPLPYNELLARGLVLPSALSNQSTGVLPAGWEERKNKDGIPYYVNHATKETQWKRPTESAVTPAGSSSLHPEGWEEKKNKDGVPYYYNHKTQATQWQRPTETVIIKPPVSPYKSSAPLPEGWEEKKNKDGLPYYVNHKTQATQWQRPTEEVIIKPPVSPNKSSAPLPEGWEERKNKDGISYYVNHKTQATQWLRPTQEAPQSSQAVRRTPSPSRAPQSSQAVRRTPSPSRAENNQAVRRRSSENTNQQGTSQASNSGQYLAPHGNQRQRKSFSEDGDSENVPNTTQAVRRKSSTSRGETNQGVRRKSTENTHKPDREQLLASHANQRQRKSFSEAGDSQNPPVSPNKSSAPLPEGWEEKKNKDGIPYYVNHKTQATQWLRPTQEVPNTSLAVRRKSSTPSKGESSHGSRRSSRDVTHRKSVSETRESQNIRSKSTNVTPGEHKSRRDKSDRSTSLSRKEQRNQSKSPINWEAYVESCAHKSSTETGLNERQKQKSSIVDSTKRITAEVKSEEISRSSVINKGPEITITNEDISQSQTTSKGNDPWQINDIHVNQKNDEEQIDNDQEFADFLNNRLSHIVTSGPKESLENIKIINKGPSNLNKGPSYISNGPASLNKGPIECTKGPSEITKGPGDLNKGPGNLSKGPCDLNQGPLEHTYKHDFTSKLARGPSSSMCCGPSIFVRGPSLSIGSCKATIGPTLRKGPTILPKGSLKQATMSV